MIEKLQLVKAILLITSLISTKLIFLPVPPNPPPNQPPQPPSQPKENADPIHNKSTKQKEIDMMIMILVIVIIIMVNY